MRVEPDQLGNRIRLLRARVGVGLRQLGRRAEVSPASLSAIEKGQTSPTLATLHRILKALGTNFSEFFVDMPTEPDVPVFQAKEMRSAADVHRKYTFLFPQREDFRFEMVEETILATERESEWEGHDCDVGGVILSGGPARIEIEGMGEWTLRRGDGFYIRAGLKHRAANLGKGPLKQLTVMDPPQY